MANFSVSKVVKGDGASAALVQTSIIESLKKNFDNVKVRVNENTGCPVITGRIRTKIWNPMVSIKAELKMVEKSDRVKVLLDGATETNGWFWFTILASFFFWPLFIVDYFMYTSQTKASVDAFEQSLHKLEFEFSDF